MRTMRRTVPKTEALFLCFLVEFRPLAGALSKRINPGSPGFFRFPKHAQTRSDTLKPELRRT